jgi:hypothetical protein
MSPTIVIGSFTYKRFGSLSQIDLINILKIAEAFYINKIKSSLDIFPYFFKKSLISFQFILLSYLNINDEFKGFAGGVGSPLILRVPKGSFNNYIFLIDLLIYS